MRRLFNTDKTYSSIVGAVGCVLLFSFGLIDQYWTKSWKHFVLLLFLLIYICATTALTEFLANRNYFIENPNAKKKFILFNGSLALIFVLFLFFLFII